MRANICSLSGISAISVRRHIFESCSAEDSGTSIDMEGEMIALSTYVWNHAVLPTISSLAQSDEVFPAGQLPVTEVSSNFSQYVQ